MQLIYDHMIASVVGLVLLVTLFLLRADQTEAAVTTTQTHAARVFQDTFVDMVEEDMANLGRGANPGDDLILAYEEDGDHFTFRSSVNDLPVTVDYRRVASGTSPDGAALFQIQRWANTGAGFQNTGGSGALVTAWEIELFDRMERRVRQNGPLDEARTVRMRVESALPFAGTGSTRAQHTRMQRTTCEAVFRPQNLRRAASYDL